MHPRDEYRLLGLDISQVDLERSGITLPLQSDDMRAISHIAVMINKQRLLELLNEYSGNLDKLAFYASTAFSYGDISVEQLATVLEIRSIKQLNPVSFSIEKINHDTLDNKKSAIAEYIEDVYGSELTDAQIYGIFLDTLQKKYNPDAYCIKFSFRPAEYTNQRFNEYSKLANALKAALFKLPTERNNKLYEITWLSAGARDAMCKAVYLSNAKEVIFNYGKGIDRQTIESGIVQYARYTATSVPGVQDPTEFHELKTPAFFLAMHDELHRQIISAIPKSVYDALLHTIFKLRKISNREWSPEIWKLVDMDFHPDHLTIGKSSPDPLSPNETTRLFFTLLSGKATDQIPLSVFLTSPYCDTTWLILMDLIENQEEWHKLGIDAAALPDEYRKMYDHVKNNLPKLSTTLSFPEKLLKLQCDFLGSTYPQNTTITFSQRMKGKATQLEVLVDGKPYFLKKSDLINLLDLINLGLHGANETIDAAIDKLSGKPDDVIRPIVDFIPQNQHGGFLLLALLNSFEKNKIDAEAINNLIKLVTTFSAIQKNYLVYFLDILALNKSLSLLTPSYLLKILSLADDQIKLLAIERPHEALLFFEALHTLNITFADLTDTHKQFLELIDFFNLGKMTEQSKKKREVYYKNLIGLSTTDKLYYLSIWREVDILCENSTDIESFFTLDRKAQATLTNLHIMFLPILGLSEINLTTFLEKYSDLVTLQSSSIEVFSIVRIFLTNDLITLEKLFTDYDQKTRNELFIKLSKDYQYINLKNFCSRHKLDLKGFLDLNTKLDGMLLDNLKQIDRFDFMDYLVTDQMTIFLNELHASIPPKYIASTLKKVADQLRYNDMPKNAKELLTMCKQASDLVGIASNSLFNTRELKSRTSKHDETKSHHKLPKEPKK